jgi:hypothetical protein
MLGVRSWRSLRFLYLFYQELRLRTQRIQCVGRLRGFAKIIEQ